MIKTKPATVPTAIVNGFAVRINALLDEKQLLVDDVREVYDEAKGEGVNTTALRKVIAKRRAKAPDPTIAAAMEAYEHALDEAASMVSNGSTSLRRAATKTGFSKSAIQRRVSHRNEDAGSGTAHDPDTGEIAETAPDVPGGEGAAIGPEIGSGSLATSFEAGNSAHEGERDGQGIAGNAADRRPGVDTGRDDGNGARRGAEGFQPERQSGRGGDQVGDGGPGGQDGEDPGPQQRAGGGGSDDGDHAPAHGQHVVRPGGDQGAVADAGRGVDAPSTPPIGAVAEGDSPQRVAAYPKGLGPDDPLEIPSFLRRQASR